MRGSLMAAQMDAAWQHGHTLGKARARRDQARLRLRWTLGTIAGLAILSVVAVPAIYFSQFHGPLSASGSEWNNFGTFVGGTLSPIFGALTIGAVLAGVLLQRAQLDLAAEQAEGALRHEDVMVRMQEATAKAMADQARHAAVNARANTLTSVRELMEQDISAIKEMRAAAVPHVTHELEALLQEAQARRDAVAAALQQLVDELIGVSVDGTPRGFGARGEDADVDARHVSSPPR